MTIQTDSSQRLQADIHDGRDSAGRHASSEVTFLELMVVLARRKRFIAAAAGIGMVAAAIVSLVLPLRYTATTTITTPRESPSLAALLTNNGQLANASLSSLASLSGPGMFLRNPNDLYIGYLQSRPVTDAIINQFDLIKLYKSADRTAARLALLQRTEILSLKSGLIAISVTDGDKTRAAEMANAYVTQLQALTQTIGVSEASQRRLFYENQLKQAKEDVVEAAYAFQQVEQEHGVVQVNAQTIAMIGRLSELRAQITAKEVEVQSLRSYSTARNPQVELAETELESLQQQAADLERRNGSSKPFDIGLGDIPTASLDYLRAEHELQYRQTLFDLLLKLYDSSRLDEAREAVVIQTIEPAVAPERRSSPQRKLIALCGLFAGFFIGCGLSLLAPLQDFVNSNPAAAKKIEDLKKALVIWKKDPRSDQSIET